MTLKISRRGQVPPFIVMEVLRAANERARQFDGDVLHLELGQPSEGPPARVLEAAHRALDRGRLGYTEEAGTRSLRSRIARHYRDFYDVEVPESRIIVTTGSSSALMLAFLAAFDPGDRIALVSPSYPGARNMLAVLGLEPVLIDAGAETSFQPSVSLLDRVDGRIDGILITSPSNPAGTVLGRDPFRDLIAYCWDRRIRVISDEIYHGITYDEPAMTAAVLTDDAIIVNSFSKYFTMTGWRLGWMVVPERLAHAVSRLIQNFYISPPTLSQEAAEVVFDCRDELDAIVAGYRRKRDLLVRELPKAGFRDFAPAQGAFYLYADVSAMTNDSAELCRRILADTGVAVVPGVDFDAARGHRYVRFSFAASMETIAEAARRLSAWRP